MNNNLIVGDTSQLSVYFPVEYDRISSRGIDYDSLSGKRYGRVFLCFAEQRTFMNLSLDDYNKVNIDLTVEVIRNLSPICDDFVFYSTSELWSNCDGGVKVDQPHDYIPTNYIRSKEMATYYMKSEFGDKVKILYPFNFNSVYRGSGFLFGKVFSSILNGEHISIGDTNFYRDMIHPRYVVERSIACTGDEIVGSGRLSHVGDFIRELYRRTGVDFDTHVTVDSSNNTNTKRKTFWKETDICLYDKLIEDTLNDITSAGCPPR